MFKKLSDYMKALSEKQPEHKEIFITRMDLAQDFYGTFLLNDIEEGFRLLRDSSFWNITPVHDAKGEDSVTCLNLCWVYKGLDPRFPERVVIYKRITIYCK